MRVAIYDSNELCEYMAKRNEKKRTEQIERKAKLEVEKRQQ